MIECYNISKTYNGQKILENISFTAEKGEKLTITGPGGCGKTTLLKIILGLEVPDTGYAKVLDVDLGRATPDKRDEVLRKVGMAFQQGGLFDFMTVNDNLMFAMENKTSLAQSEMISKVDRLLLAVKLPNTKELYPHQLSGGMARRVGIARALSTSPSVAIFDEPTAGLDPVTSSIILNMIGELGADYKDTIMMVSTSNVEIAIRFARRLIMLNEGKIIADDDWHKLILDGSEWIKHFLSVRLIGLDKEYAQGLNLPPKFFESHWAAS